MYVRSIEEELTPMQMDAYIKRATSCFQGRLRAFSQEFSWFSCVISLIPVISAAVN